MECCQGSIQAELALVIAFWDELKIQQNALVLSRIRYKQLLFSLVQWASPLDGVRTWLQVGLGPRESHNPISGHRGSVLENF